MYLQKMSARGPQYSDVYLQTIEVYNYTNTSITKLTKIDICKEQDKGEVKVLLLLK